jgi:uncharacterized membrane protein
MAFCPSCGAQVEGRFCAKCGTQVGAGAPAGGAGGYQQQQAPPPPPYQQPSYQQAAPGAGGMTTEVASGLCYILGFITGILFLVMAPYSQNRAVRFHAFQSIFLHVGGIVLWILMGIFTAVLPNILKLLMIPVSALLGLAIMGLWLFTMVKAFQGGRFVIPVIGPLAEKQANS